jgi:uridine monophosphate synthetase
MAEIDELSRGLWQTGAIKFGEFTLKSGIISPFYINLRFLITIPSVLKIASHAMCEKAKGLKFDRVAGIPYGGLPMGVLISQELDKPLIYPRKEMKQHGDIRAIEGDFHKGEIVLVVDDLITDGQSKLEAIEAIKNEGMIVNDIIILVDREQGGAARMAEKGYHVKSVLTISGLLGSLKKQALIPEVEFSRSMKFVHDVQFS